MVLTPVASAMIAGGLVVMLNPFEGCEPLAMDVKSKVTVLKISCPWGCSGIDGNDEDEESARRV